MPISREQRKLYPSNWSTEIVPRILQRAKYRCETCSLARYTVGRRLSDGTFITWTVAGSYAEGRQAAAVAEQFSGWKHTVIVLAISHSCHDPQCEDDAHLFSRCQYDHLLVDRPHHARNARATWRRKRQNV